MPAKESKKKRSRFLASTVLRVLFKGYFTWAIQYDIINPDKDNCLPSINQNHTKFMSITTDAVMQSSFAGLPLLPLIRNTLFGIGGLIMIMLFHGGTINFIIMRFEKHTNQNLAKKQYNHVFFHFYFTFFFIAIIHLTEIVIWTIYVDQLHLIDSAIQTLLFVGSCYTTVGFVEDVLPDGWKSLAFFISFSGLFSIAWTTSAMINMTNCYKAAWNLKHNQKDPNAS